jgi:hypothetical protein
MQKTETSVQDLVAMIEKGELRLPEMQRGYVWKATRIRDLLDSLYRGYPSGNILVWETDSAMPLRDMAVDQNESPFKGFKLLLDGQQRLTSLSCMMRGQPVQVRGRQRPIDILFNLDHPEDLEEVLEVEEDEDSDPDGVDDDESMDDDVSIEERVQKLTFVVASRRIAAMPNWISATRAFQSDADAEFLRKAGVKGFDDPRYELYSKRLQKLRQIRKYMYSVQVLERDMSYDEVTEVFVRVNSLGAKLRSSDLALAQITARWRGALATFEEFAAECDDQGFPIQLGTLVRALVVIATGQSRFKTTSTLSLSDLKEAWNPTKLGLRFAVNFVRNNAQIDGPALLTSPYILLALAFASHQRNHALSEEDARKLRLWVLLANGRGRYGRGSSETYLDQDLATIRQGTDAMALIDAIRLQFGRFHFDIEELDGRNQRASLFRLMFQALKAAGACDWMTAVKISPTSFGAEHKLQFHHIFPRAVLKGHYSKAMVNDIANLAFIGGRTNRTISAKAPSEYLASVITKQGAQSMEMQCVPQDVDLWKVERYPDFLSARRKLLVERMNSFIGQVP